MLHCSVLLVVAVLGFVIVHNSIQNHMSITNTFKFAYSFIRLPKLSARNFAEGLATLLLAPVFLGDFFRTGVAGMSSPSSILEEMRLHNIKISSLLEFALSDPLHHSGIINADDIVPIFNMIAKTFTAGSDSWALARGIQIYQGEIRRLTSAGVGLQANAAHLVADQISSFSIPALCEKLVIEVPRLWRLMMSLLDMNTIDNSEETLPDELPQLQHARLKPVVRGHDTWFKTCHSQCLVRKYFR